MCTQLQIYVQYEIRGTQYSERRNEHNDDNWEGWRNNTQDQSTTRAWTGLPTQLKPGGKGIDTKTGKIWRVRGQEAEQTLVEWEKHNMDAVHRKDAQESIEESEVKTIQEPGPRALRQSQQGAP